MGLFSRKKQQAEPHTVTPLTTFKANFLSYQVANLQGIGKRQNQEDSFGFANVLDVTKIKDKGMLAVVTDGMGGMKGGKLASDTAVASLRSDFENFDYSLDLAEQLERSVFNASEKIFSLLDGDGGSTLIACIFYDEKLYFASVGDSYLFLKRDNHLIHLNRKHTVMYDGYLSAVSRGSLDKTDAESDPEKHALTRFLGMDELEDFDISRRPLPIKDGDVFLLCSDGVGGVLSEPCIYDCLSSCPAPVKMCEQLELNIINTNKRYQDNYTALIVKCEY